MKEGDEEGKLVLADFLDNTEKEPCASSLINKSKVWQ